MEECADPFTQKGRDLVTLETLEEKRGNLGKGLERKEETGLKAKL